LKITKKPAREKFTLPECGQIQMKCGTLLMKRR